MSSLIQGATIYTGAWIDWSKGAVLGSTITLSTRYGAVLTAFLAFFVTIIGACLWRILSYTIHQFSATPEAKDGMHHQHQLIFRNTTAPAEAARAFAENAWSWRKNGTKAWSRSLPLAGFAIIFMLGFGVASLLTGFVTRGAGSARLIVSNDCGFFALDSGTSVQSQIAMTSKDLSDTVKAAAYARMCYGKDAAINSVQCKLYVKQALQWTTNNNANCPFDDNICSSAAYSLDTGYLDSHEDFGINAPASGRVAFRKITTCAPLKQEGYVSVETSDGTLGAKGDQIRYYNYGSWQNTGFLVPNATYWHNQHSFVEGIGYQLDARVHAGNSSDVGWVPVRALKKEDADTTIVFLAANAMEYWESNNDPLFKANNEIPITILGEDQKYYMSDAWVNVMACTDQYQLCSSKNGENCTPLSGWYDTFNDAYGIGLNEIQKMVASRFSLNIRTLSMFHSIGGRSAAALRAQETVNDLSQFPIPDNQWQIEIDAWFATSLARLQRSIVSYAAGFENVLPGSHIQGPDGPISKTMCYSQKVAQTSDGRNDTISFSVLGIAIILVVGVVTILIYLCLEMIVGLVQKRYNWGDYRRLRWIMDDKMQIQRMAFEEAGMGDWTGLTNNYPVTEKGQVFGQLHHVDFTNPRLGHKWTSEKNPPSLSSSQTSQKDFTTCEPTQGAVAYQKPVYQRVASSESQSHFSERV